MTVARWLVLGSHIPPKGGLGGMIRYTVEVTRSLHQRADTEVHVHCRSDAAGFLEGELGIPPSRVHGSASGSTVRDSLAERYSIHRLAADIGADVVFGSKQLIPRSSGGAIRVLTVHDMLPFDRPSDFGAAKRLLLPAAYRQSVRNADVLACVSHAARDRLIHHIPDARPRAEVVQNAMTSLLTETDPEPIPELVGRRFAVMVGDRSARKNAGFIVGLWPDVVAKVPDAVLAMVGPPGWGRNVAIAGLEDLAECGSIVELGRVGDGSLRWAYENAAATLCPSLLEGFGLPVVEALTLGCPTLISLDPAQVEAAAGRATALDVRDGAGWVDAIVEHLTDGRSAPARPSERTWDDVASDLVASVSRASLSRASLSRASLSRAPLQRASVPRGGVLGKVGRGSALLVRHADLARRRRLVRVDLNEIVDEFGFGLTGDGWNHYTALLAEFERNSSQPLEATAFWRFFNDRRVNEVRDLNDLLDLGSQDRPFQDLPRFWLGTYPWGGLLSTDIGTPGQPFGWAHDDATGRDTSELWGRGRNLWYRPADRSTLENEWRLTVELYHSIKRSYSPIKSRGFPTVTLLRKADGRRRAVIVDGHHRLAVLAHLGVTSVMVEVEAVVELAEIETWPHVRSGRCSRQQASRFFEALFELDGSERFEFLERRWSDA